MICSPHTQGCPEVEIRGSIGVRLFPAHAGMTRTGAETRMNLPAFPRTRRDDPTPIKPT